ncbi:MAG: hypothetical protein ACP5E3_13045, partial [Bacteroidales bacterium]
MEMKRKNIFKVLKPGVLLAMLLMFFLNSCVKEEFSINKLDTSLDIDPALATPIGFFDFKMQKIINTTENTQIIT